MSIPKLQVVPASPTPHQVATMRSSVASITQRPAAQGSVLPAGRQVLANLPMLSRTLPASATCAGKQSASTQLSAAGRALHTTCRAGTQSNRVTKQKEVAVPKAAGDFNIPRGETAGAAMVLEGVTVQAGDRDLLEVSLLAVSDQQAATNVP